MAIIGENEPEHFWAEFAAQALGAKVVSLYPDLTADEMQYLLEDCEARRCLVAQDQEQVDKGLAVAPRLAACSASSTGTIAGMWSYRAPAAAHLRGRAGTRPRRASPATPGASTSELAAGRRDDIAVLSYTSGTTGRPKGVILTHRYLFDNACAHARRDRASSRAWNT